MSGLDAIRVVVVVLVVVGTAAAYVLPRPETVVGRVHLPLLGISILIAIAELASIHLDLGRERHTISMAEFPYTLALFMLLPLEQLIAQAIGLLLVLTFVRRQTPLKLLFNVAQSWVATAAGISVFHALVPDAIEALAPLAWGAAALSAVTAAAVSAAIVSHVIALMDGRVGVQNLRSSILGASAGALGNASLALMVVTYTEVAVTGLLLLVLPLVGLFGAYRVYERQRAANRSLAFLYNISQSLAGEAEVDTSLAELTDTVRSRMNVRTATIVVAPSGGDQQATGIISRAEEEEEPRVEHRPLTELEHMAVTSLYAAGSLLLSGTDAGYRHGFDRGLLHEMGLTEDTILVSLHGPDRPLGFVVVSERLGDLDTLDESDQELLVAVANQLSTSLTAARLENSLSELHRLQETLRHRADHDALTGLCNRFRFTVEVDEELRRAPRSTAVLFLDLDDFKTINDSLGHHVGDELLRAVARRLESAIKISDLVARLGGDEFAVLLRDVDDDRAATVAERLAAVLTEPFELEIGSVRVGTSVGIAQHDGDGTTDAATLLRNADAAMYAAKREGGSATRSFEQAMHDEARKRLLLRNDLQRGLSQDEFTIFVQPLVELQSDRVIGAEALLRWEHPEQGLLTPGHFLDLAEESGMMRELGLRVLHEACTVASVWPSASIISVNLSRSQLLADDELIEEVRQILELTGLAPSRLLLEITEFAVMSNIDRSIQVLRDLTDLGVRIALDDFGTGYSSLQHLARLPVHVLKVAKPFVDALSGEVPDQTALIAHGIIEMADALGLDTISEGIEHPEQADVLRRWGSRIGQGYLLGRPMTATQFSETTGWPPPPIVPPFTGDQLASPSAAARTLDTELAEIIARIDEETPKVPEV